MSALLTRLLRPAATLLVVLLVTGAVLLTTLRVLLLSVSEYRHSIEGLVSSYLEQPVSIASAEGRLIGLTPTLVVKEVKLLDPVDLSPIAQFSEARLTLDLLASWQRGEPTVGELAVVGVDLEVERLPDGSLEVKGFSLPDSSGETEFGQWMLGQGRLAIRDSRLLWRDSSSLRQFRFESVNLDLRNQGDHHTLTGDLLPPGDLASALSVAVEAEGDVLTTGRSRGRFYLKADKVRPEGWFSQIEAPPVTIKAGEGGIDLWGEWDASGPSVLEGALQGSGLVAASSRGEVTVDRIGSRFRWVRHPTGWTLDLADLQLERGGRSWEPGRIQVSQRNLAATEAPRIERTLRATFLRIEDLAAFSVLLPDLNDEWRKRLAELSPRGELRQAALRVDPDKAVSGHADFSGLAVQPVGELPGVSRLDGRLTFKEKALHLSLATRSSVVQLPKLLREPLQLDAVEGDIDLVADERGWRVEGRRVNVATPDIALRVMFALDLPTKGSPFLELESDFGEGRAIAVPHYLPTAIMEPEVVKWLDAAFHNGRVVGGGALFHGRLADFPFDRREGRFEVRFKVQGVELDYLPKWPHLRDIDAEVLFDGRGMVINASGARLLGSRVGPTVVAIRDLMHPLLNVRGQAEGSLEDLIQYLRVTGLTAEFDRAVSDLKPTGRMRLGLEINQPLEGDGKSRYSGVVDLLDARLLLRPGVTLTDVKGALGFSDSGFAARGLRATLFGQPFTATVFSRGGEGDRETQVVAEGRADLQQVAEAFHLPLLKRLEGMPRVAVAVTIPHQGEAFPRLQVTGDLRDVVSHFPAPFDKRAGGVSPLRLEMPLGGEGDRRIDLGFENRVSALLEVTSEGALRRGALHFGRGGASLPRDESLLVTGSIDRLSLDGWSLSALQGEGAGGGQAARPLPRLLVRLESLGLVSGTEGAAPPNPARPMDLRNLPPMDISVERFSVEGRKFGTLSFNVRPAAGQMVLRDLLLVDSHMKLTGSGVWRYGPPSRSDFDLAMESANFGAAIRDIGFATTVAEGRARMEGKVWWNGSPAEFEMAALNGNLSVDIRDGYLEEVSPGAGRLLGLFSLQALLRRLTLDFRDLYESGVRFRSIVGRMEIKGGEARSDVAVETLPAAVMISGRTGLVRRDYDQTITVIPEVSDSLPVAGGLALGPQVGAALLLFQKIFKSQIDQVAKYEYHVTGSWDAPVVQRVANETPPPPAAE